MLYLGRRIIQQPTILDVNKQDDDIRYNIYNNDIVENEFKVIEYLKSKTKKFKYTKKKLLNMLEVDTGLTGIKETEYRLKKIVDNSGGKPKIGDVFLLTVNGHEYYYGKVIDYFDKVGYINKELGVAIVLIFSCTTKEKTMKDYKPNYKDLYLFPLAIKDDYFEEGYLEVIDNVEINDDDKLNMVGFFGYDVGFKYNDTREKENDKRTIKVGVTYQDGLELELKIEKIARMNFLTAIMELRKFKDEQKRLDEEFESRMKKEYEKAMMGNEEIVDKKEIVDFESSLADLINPMKESVSEGEVDYEMKDVEKLEKIIRDYYEDLSKANVNDILKYTKKAIEKINELDERLIDDGFIETEEREEIVDLINNIAYTYGYTGQDDITGEWRDW